jgi:hypothetical protein
MQSLVRACINNKRKTHKNFIWKRVIENVLQTEINYPNEIWFSLKDSIYTEIKNFKNYKVSNLGRVKGYKDKLLVPNTSSGRSVIQLINGSETKYMKVHRMVLMASNTPNPENKPEVDHIDSNPKNHHLNNLRWATKEEQRNNPNTKIKLVISVKVINTENNEETIHRGVYKLAKKLKTSYNTINNCSITGKLFGIYKFEIIPK